jgi:hypothetical protein
MQFALGITEFPQSRVLWIAIQRFPARWVGADSDKLLFDKQLDTSACLIRDCLSGARLPAAYQLDFFGTQHLHVIILPEINLEIRQSLPARKFLYASDEQHAEFVEAIPSQLVVFVR